MACLSVLCAAVLASAALMRPAAPHRPAPSAPAPAAGPLALPQHLNAGWLAQHPAPELGVKAESGILIDLDTGRVLWARQEHSSRAPASLTKLMTAMIATDHARLTDELRVPPEAASMEPDLMGLSAGEVVTVQDLLYGLFLDSGNDAAEALARGLIPRDRFIAEMNVRAAQLGLAETHFTNPTGLDEPGLRSSAWDLAVLARQLTGHYPQLLRIASQKEVWIPPTAEHKGYSAVNLNKLLRTYPGAEGLKTGLTDDAGGCVIATAGRGKRHLLAVVMHSDLFFTDAGRLLDYGFATAAA